MRENFEDIWKAKFELFTLTAEARRQTQIFEDDVNAQLTWSKLCIVSISSTRLMIWSLIFLRASEGWDRNI